MTNKSRALELGALNGIIFGSLFEVTYRSLFLWETYRLKQTPAPEGLSIDLSPYPFRWWYLPVLSLVLVSLASLLVHRLLSRSIESTIWRWQIIGVVAVLGCFVYVCGMDGLRWYAEFTYLGAGYLLDVVAGELRWLSFVLPLVLGYNLIFGAVLRSRNRALYGGAG